MSAILASLRDLSVTYRSDGNESPALSGIDLDIMTGERLAVIGESGSGKSTLALALAGLLPEEARVAGRIEWPGLAQEPRAGRDIGFVFQDPGASLNPVIRVGEQVAEVVRRHLDMGSHDAEMHVRALLQRVQLPTPQLAMSAFPHQLSGGQRQRVAIAAAIAANPRLLIADEPTSALDTIVQGEIVALLNQLVREDGLSLIFITHDIALASGFADRIAVLHQARLAEVGPAQSLLKTPEAAYTARLIASHIGLETTPLVGGAPA